MKKICLLEVFIATAIIDKMLKDEEGFQWRK